MKGDGKKPPRLMPGVHGGCAAMNRGADCVEHPVPALRA